MNYMMSSSGLNITPYDEADLNSNYIYTIAPILPAKSDVLSYLYGDGSQPQVKAKVSSM